MNEQLHSYDNNNYFPYDGFEWCNVKCENDLDYVQPYMPGDNLSIQWKMPYGYFMGFWALVQGSSPFGGIAGNTFYWKEVYGIENGIDVNNCTMNIIVNSSLCSSATMADRCFRINVTWYDDVYGSSTNPVLNTNSVLFSCNPCEPTVLINSEYNIAGTDCLGNYYSPALMPDDYGSTQVGSGLPIFSFRNIRRIYAKLKKLPSKLTISSNSNCYLYKSELVESYELQGTRLYPPNEARIIENIMTGKNFTINNEQFQVRGETIFTPVDERGMSMFRLKAQLEKCPCEVAFDCN